MSTLLLTIAILLVLLIVSLAIPISMNYYITRNQQLQGYANVNGFFGLMKFQTRFPREPENKSKDETKSLRRKKNPSPDKAKPSNTKNNMKGVALLKQSTFRRHIMHFIKRIFAASHAQDLYLRCRIGLSDPADTGMLWAVMGPLSAMLKNVQTITIDLQPEFTDSVIEIESHGRFQLIPIQFIALTLVFILSPTTIQAWRTMQQDSH